MSVVRRVSRQTSNVIFVVVAEAVRSLNNYLARPCTYGGKRLRARARGGTTVERRRAAGNGPYVYTYNAVHGAPQIRLRFSHAIAHYSRPRLRYLVKAARVCVCVRTPVDERVIRELASVLPSTPPPVPRPTLPLPGTGGRAAGGGRRDVVYSPEARA